MLSVLNAISYKDFYLLLTVDLKYLYVSYAVMNHIYKARDCYEEAHTYLSRKFL